MGKVQDFSSECGQLPFSDPIRVLEHLRPQVDALLSVAIAKNTADTCQWGLESFSSFRNKFSLPLRWHPPVHQLVNYVAYLPSNSISTSTAKCYLSGISYQLQLHVHVDYTKSIIVRKMLEGMRRLHPSKGIRAPITFFMLSRLIFALSSVCSNSYEAVYNCLWTNIFELSILLY